MRIPATPYWRGLLAAFLVAIALAACTHSDPVSRGRIAAFDTNFNITMIGVDRRRTKEMIALLKQDLGTMQDAWHAWKPGPLALINQHFNEGSLPFAAPPSVLPLLRLSQTLSRQSNGLFNPAIGHLVRSWGFQGRPRHCMRPPSDALIQQAVDAKPSMQDIALDGFHLSSSNTSVKLDFRGIQIGYAMDQVVARLREAGIANASVSVNGNVRAIGSRDGRPWTITVRGAQGGGILATLQILGNEAAFTVGSYQNNFAWQGEIFHDIIDPRTGRPATETASVTVLHPHASTANAAANALFVAGPDQWHRIARQMGIRYVMLTDVQGRLHMSPAMQARTKLHSRPQEIVVSEPLT